MKFNVDCSMQDYFISSSFLLVEKEKTMMTLLKIGVLMYQIHMNPEAALLSGFGFRLGCLESLLRSVLDSYTKLDQSVLKQTKCFSMQRKNNRLNC